MPTDLAHDTGLRGLSGPGKDLHTGVWHGDHAFDLPIPVDWQVTALWPPTPAPLTERQIVDCLSKPAGQIPIGQAAEGKKNPLIILDSTDRPTPAARLLPHILWQLRQGGIDPGKVKLLVATGLQGAPRPESLIKKLGPAAADCELIVHHPRGECVEVGTIPPGISIRVNREVVQSDFVVGVEGIYPRSIPSPHAATLLSVLDAASIRQIEKRAPDPVSVSEHMAELVNVHTSVSAQVDADRNLVRLACGDRRQYFDREMAFARATFGAPGPDEADVVVVNAYPCDLSLATVIRESFAPLAAAAPHASRILLASCAEGRGPLERSSAWKQALSKPLNWFRRRNQAPHANPVWLFRPELFGESIPAQEGEIRVVDAWPKVVQSVAKEQSNRRFCRVFLYPCAPLQLLREPYRV